MKRLIFPLTAAMLPLAPLPALAQAADALQGFYFSTFGGIAYLADQEIEDGAVERDIDYDVPAYVVGGQIGYALDINIRIEAELSYMVAEGDSVLELAGAEIFDVDYDLSVLSGTAGIYLDLWPIRSFVPYVGGGIGYARAENEINDDKNTQNALTAFGEAGLPLALTPNFSIVPAVRFSWVGLDEDVDDVFADDLFNGQLRVGTRFTF